MSPEIDDPDLMLAELFGVWPAAARVFLAHRMACVGCPIAPFHGVRDACAQYGLHEDAFRAELRAAVASQPARPLRRGR
jgi:hybrid cluster-associated redox disulfide protein